VTAPVDVEAIRARADAATAGPWRWNSTVGCEDFLVGTDEALVLDPGMPYPDWVCIHASDADRRFIAQARTDVPALCDALEHERRVSAAWKALARAVALGAIGATREATANMDLAMGTLRALGIDPEAP